jgi:hypothetical protein
MNEDVHLSGRMAMKIKTSHLSTLLVLMGLAGSLLVLATGAAAQATLPQPGSTWIEVTTRHFVVVSEGTEGATRELATDLERMVQALGQVIAQPGGTPEKTRVVLFSSARAFEDTCTPALGRSCAGLGAALQQGASGNTLLLDGSGADGMRTAAYRALTHILVRRGSPSAPLWLDTGLVELFGSLSIHGTDVKIGRPNPGHLALVQAPGALDVPTLLGADRSSPGLVAGSWLLTHYLVVGKPDRSGQISRYLAEVGSGRSPVEACATAFGAPPDALGREVLAHAQGPAMNEIQLTPGELAADTISAPRGLSRTEALGTLALPAPAATAVAAAPGPSATAPGETPPPTGTPTGVTAIINTDLQEKQRKAFQERAAASSQKEADLYNQAVGLYNRKDYAGALRIAEDLAANANNAEVKAAAASFVKRIRAKMAAPKP